MFDRTVIAVCALLLAGSAAVQSAQVATIVHAGQLLADPASGRVELERSILIQIAQLRSISFVMARGVVHKHSQ